MLKRQLWRFSIVEAMIIDFTTTLRRVIENCVKLIAAVNATCERIALFAITQQSILDNHLLSGGYKDTRSINATGDLLALYQPISKTKAFYYR